MDAVMAGVLSALSTGAGAWILSNFAARKVKSEQTHLEDKLRGLEKQIHLNETKFLEHKNKADTEYREQQRVLTATARDEGYKLGLEERDAQHQVLLATLKSDHREAILKEREEAASDAREHLRREMEMQAKLFSVLIKPYVKIEKDKGFIFDDLKSYTGYQYQLLVNGIPAFQPHVMVEHTEEIKEVNEAKLKALTELALKAANHAAQLYLSGVSGSALKMGDVIIERTAS